MKRTELKRKKPWRPKVKPREPRTPPGMTLVNGGARGTGEGLSIPTARVRLPPPPSPKRSRPKKTTPARQAAKGKPCLIRLPGCAPGAENETVVLCHFPMADISGAGLKSPDQLGAYGCWHCHGVVDGRLPLPLGYSKTDVRLAHALAVFRTWLYNMKDLHFQI